MPTTHITISNASGIIFSLRSCIQILINFLIFTEGKKVLRSVMLTSQKLLKDNIYMYIEDERNDLSYVNIIDIIRVL